MARVQRFDRNVLANEVQPAMIGLAGSTAGAVASVADTTANVLGTIAQAEKQVQEQTWLTEATVKLQTQMIDAQEAMQKDFSETPDGYSKKATEAYKKSVQGLMQGAPSRGAKLAFNKITGSMQADMYGKWRSWESNRKIEIYASSLDNSLQQLGTLAYRQADPGELANLQNQVEMAMVGADGLLAPDVIGKTKQKAMESVAQNLWMGVNERNPYNARKLLDSKQLDSMLPPEKLAGLREKSQNEIERREREARQEAALRRAEQRDVLADVEAAMRAGQLDDVPEGALDVFEGKERERWTERLQSARQFGKDAQTFMFAGEDEVQELLAQRTTALTEGGVEGFREEARDIGSLRQIFAQREAAMKEDAAAYAAQSPAMRERFAALQEAQQAQDPELVAKANQDYLTALAAEQKRLGVPAEQMRYVPKAQAQQLVNQYMQLPDIRQKEEYLGRLEQQYGRFWPSVAYHMRQEGMPAGFSLVGELGTSTPQGRALLSASTELPEIKKVLGEQFTGIVKKSNTAVKDLTDALSAQPGGLSYAAEIQSAVGLIASKMVASGGEDIDNATTKAAKAFKDKFAKIGDTYVIPKQIKSGYVDATRVEKRLNEIRKNINLNDVDRPINGSGFSAETDFDYSQNRLRANSYFVNNGTEDMDGFYLMWETGDVVTKNGKPLQWKIEDLQAIKTQREKEDPVLRTIKDAIMPVHTRLE